MRCGDSTYPPPHGAQHLPAPTGAPAGSGHSCLVQVLLLGSAWLQPPLHVGVRSRAHLGHLYHGSSTQRTCSSQHSHGTRGNPRCWNQLASPPFNMQVPGLGQKWRGALGPCFPTYSQDLCGREHRRQLAPACGASPSADRMPGVACVPCRAHVIDAAWPGCSPRPCMQLWLELRATR